MVKMLQNQNILCFHQIINPIVFKPCINGELKVNISIDRVFNVDKETHIVCLFWINIYILIIKNFF